MMNTKLLKSNRSLPFVVEPDSSSSGKSDPSELISWYKEHNEEIEERLLEHGAILFRGFGVNTPSAFARLTRSVTSALKDCMEENVPRTKLTAGVYTSTEYPSEYMLSMHSEYSYSNSWPSKLFFCCITAPREGGETPIADNREVLRDLYPGIVDEFKQKKVTYLRNLHDGEGFGLSWQSAFQTTDKLEVEHYCRTSSIEFKWRDDGGLALSQTLPGVITHPVTGEEIWFNQAPQFHPSDYPEEIYKSLLASYDEKDLPQNVCFGDGSSIDVTTLHEIRETMKNKAVIFPWQEGDLLVLDNVLVSHGRMPFTGPRKILVAMA